MGVNISRDYAAPNSLEDLEPSTGPVNITTGDDNPSDPILIKTGDSSSNNSGNITIETGTAAGTRGKIKLVDGTEGTIGHVWTQVAADGSGAWQPAGAFSGAQRDLSNLLPTSINEDLLPDSHGARNLGSSANKWNQVLSRTFIRGQNSGQENSQWDIFTTFKVPTTSIDGIKTIIASSNTGLLTLESSGGGFSTGRILLETGPQLVAGAGPTGSIDINTGRVDDTAATDDSGDVNITTGDRPAGVGTGQSGSINISTGTNTDGSTGPITLTTGNSSTVSVGGNININAGIGTASRGDIQVRSGTFDFISVDLIDHRQTRSDNVVWENGATGSRPGAPNTGQRFFDTTLGIPIWFDGTNWVDATGSTV